MQLEPTMIRGAPPVPPFWKRVLLLPFVPRMWSDARGWTAGAVLLPLFVSATLWSGALATYRGFEARHDLAQLAADWDANFDAVVLSNGEVHVEGERLPRGEEKGSLMLVDPEETIPTPRSGGYIIVRKRTIIRDSGPSVDLKQLQDFLGKGPLRIEGKTVTSWLARWGVAMRLGLLVFLVGFEWMGTALGALEAASGAAAAALNRLSWIIATVCPQAHAGTPEPSLIHPHFVCATPVAGTLLWCTTVRRAAAPGARAATLALSGHGRAEHLQGGERVSGRMVGNDGRAQDRVTQGEGSNGLDLPPRAHGHPSCTGAATHARRR